VRVFKKGVNVLSIIFLAPFTSLSITTLHGLHRAWASLCEGRSGGSAHANGDPCSKIIYGLPQTIRTLETLFNGYIWPKLAVRQEELAPDFFYRYKPISPRDDYVRVAHGISARVMPVTHGACAQTVHGTYESSAWFVRNDGTGREFLFFGDVEPDSISLQPRTRSVWKSAAKKIKAQELDTIFLECSWRSSRPTSSLFGHLSPPHILDELRALATEIKLLDNPGRDPPPRPRSFFSFFWQMLGYDVSDPPPKTLPNTALKGTLDGLKLVLIHFKASDTDLPQGNSIGDVISDEVRELVEASGLGISVITTRQGMKLEI